MRSVSRRSSIRSKPAAPTLFTILLLITLTSLQGTAGTRPHQRLQLVHEFGNVLELQIHGSKTYIGDFIKLFQSAHDLLADLTRWPLALRRFLHIFFDRVHNAVQFRRRHRTLFTSSQKSGHNLVAVERLATAILLDHHVGDFVDSFIRSEAPFAFQTFAPPPDRFAFP